MSVIYLNIQRADHDQSYIVYVVTVAVTFSSRCIAPALAATRTDPPWGAEYEHEIESIDVFYDEHLPLTDEELASVAERFPEYWRLCDQIARDEGVQ